MSVQNPFIDCICTQHSALSTQHFAIGVRCLSSREVRSFMLPLRPNLCGDCYINKKAEENYFPFPLLFSFWILIRDGWIGDEISLNLSGYD